MANGPLYCTQNYSLKEEYYGEYSINVSNRCMAMYKEESSRRVFKKENKRAVKRQNRVRIKFWNVRNTSNVRALKNIMKQNKLDVLTMQDA